MGAFRDWIQIVISEDKRKILSSNRDLRIIYIYEGKARLSLNGASLTLRKDDFYVVNSGESAEYHMEQAGFAGIIQLKYALAEEYLELQRCYIVCSSLQEHILLLRDELLPAWPWPSGRNGPEAPLHDPVCRR